MLVLCTGMIRSGSTWSYNVARLLLGRCAPRVHGIYSDSPTEVMLHHGLDVDHCVIKCHDPDRAARVLIKHRLCRTIYTYREPIDCLASTADLGLSFEPTLERLRASLELLEFQRAAGGVHLVWYDDIIERPRDRVRAIADYLELEVGDEIVDAVAEMLTRDRVRYVIRSQQKSAAQLAGAGLQWDPKTLFNERHIRDNPSDPAVVVGADHRAAVVAALSAWTDAAGRLRLAVRAPGMLTPPPPEPEPEPDAAGEPMTVAADADAPDTLDSTLAPDPVPEPAPEPDPLPASQVAAPAPDAGAPAAAAPAPTPAPQVRPPRTAAQRPTEAAKLAPAAVAERQRLARDLLRIIDSQRRPPTPPLGRR